MPKERFHTVDAQHRGVFGLRDQAADCGFDSGWVDRGELGARFSEHPFRERGSAGDGRRTAADFVGNLGDAAVLEARRESQDIAASGIGDFHRDSRRRELAHVARILEVIEKSFAVHYP